VIDNGSQNIALLPFLVVEKMDAYKIMYFFVFGKQEPVNSSPSKEILAYFVLVTQF